MTPPVPPEPSIAAKLAANLRYLRESGASRVEIDAEIARAKAAMQAQSSRERDPGLGRGLLQQGLQGATFGFGDEIIAAGRALTGDRFDDALAEERSAMAAFQEQRPGTALAAQVAGGFAMPLSVLGPAAKGASMLSRAGRAAGEAAIQGGLGGLGAAEEGTLTGALKGAAKGATAGLVVGGGLSGVAGAGRALTRPLRTQTAAGATAAADEALSRTIGQVRRPDGLTGRAAIEASLAEAEAAGRGADVMLMDAAGVPGMRLVRGAAAGSPEADQLARQRLGQRTSRAGDRLIGDLTETAGVPRQEATQTVAELTAARAEKAQPLYDAAAAEASAFDAIPSQLQAELEAAAAAPKMLPPPGQTADALAKRGLPPVATEGDRTLREAVDAFHGRNQPKPLGEATPLPDAEPTGRRVVLRGANDTAVRRPAVEVPEAPRPDGPVTEWQARANEVVSDPDIAKFVADAKRANRGIRSLPDTDHRVLDQAYKLMNDRFRDLERTLRGPSPANASRAEFASLNEVRTIMREAIAARSPSYKEALDAFAGDSALLNAFDRGRGALGDDVGELKDWVGSAASSEREAAVRGLISTLADQVRDRAPAEGLDEAARAVDLVGGFLGKGKVAERFKVLVGADAYEKLAPRLKQELLFTIGDRGVRNQSATMDKAADLAASAPSLAADFARATIGGQPTAAGFSAARTLIPALMRGENVGRAAVQQAEAGLTQGSPAIRALLDAIEARQRPSPGVALTPRGRADITAADGMRGAMEQRRANTPALEQLLAAISRASGNTGAAVRW